MNTQDVLYHYTTGNVFRRILGQGAIEPDRTEPQNEKEVPTVTFSSNPVWENTRYRVGKLPDGQLVMMNKDLLRQFDGGLYRIVVSKDIAPLDWHAMKDQCGMSRQAIKGVYDFAIEVGARTSQWFATLQSVPEESWLMVQKLNDANEWVDLTDEEIPKPSADDSPMVDLGATPVLEL